MVTCNCCEGGCLIKGTLRNVNMIIVFCEECDALWHSRNLNNSLPEEAYNIFDLIDILKFFNLPIGQGYCVEEGYISEEEFLKHWNEQ